MISFGLHRLHQWNNIQPITTVLTWIDAYTKRYNDFDPERAGLHEAIEQLVRAQTILSLDSVKPDYASLVGRTELLDGIEYALLRTDRLQTRLMMRQQTTE